MYVEKRVFLSKDGSTVERTMEIFHLTPAETAVHKSRMAFRDASLAATSLMTAVLAQPGITKSEKPATAAALGALAKHLIQDIAAKTCRPLEEADLFATPGGTRIERSVPAQDDPNDMTDST